MTVHCDGVRKDCIREDSVYFLFWMSKELLGVKLSLVEEVEADAASVRPRFYYGICWGESFIEINNL